MKAGKRTAKEIKQFLEASYQDKPPETIGDFVLDKQLSKKTGKVYYNPQTGKAVVIHRGTQGTTDWLNNLAYITGNYEKTNRYKQGKKTQDRAEAKYGKKNIDTIAHSQGAILARKLGTDTNSIINVNPAYTFEKPAKNEYNIRSSTDVISSLYAPVAKTKEREQNDITIPSQSTTDVLGEHSYEILDRLGEKEIGVGAGNKISSNSIMYKGGKRYSRLGYTGEDIDWIGAGAGASIMLDRMNPQNRGIVFFNEGELVAPPEYYSDSDISEETLPETFDLSESDDEPTTGGKRIFPTNNNSGAVGTAYVNRGTNRYGVRGGAIDRNEYRRLSKLMSRLNRRITKLELSNDTEWNGINVGEQLANIENLLQDLDTLGEDEEGLTGDELQEYLEDAQQQEEEMINNIFNAINEVNEIITGVESSITDVETESDEDTESEEEGAGRMGGKVKKPSLKSFQKGITKMGSTFSKATDAINPMSYAIKNKGTRDAMISSGETTHDYLLPAVVSAGKPIYDATAMTASTMLTGNPVLGKTVADTMWNEMVAKKGNDPRQNQKSKELGVLSETFGKAAAKPYSAALGGGFHDGHSNADKYFKPPKGLRRGNGRADGFKLFDGGRRDIKHDIEDEKRKAEKAEDKARYLARPRPPSPPPRIPLTQDEIGDIFQGYGRRKGGSRLTILEKLYDIVNPPDSFEAWKERNQNRKITKAMKEEIDVQHEAMLMRQKADALERKAKETKEQKIKSAKEYGEFENVGEKEVERIRMTMEDKASKDLRTEGKIAKEDPEYAMEGKGLKGGSNDALMKAALLVGVPIASLVGCVSVGQIYDLIQQYRGRVAPAPQQEEFKEEMPDIEEGGRRKKMKGGNRKQSLLNKMTQLRQTANYFIQTPNLQGDFEDFGLLQHYLLAMEQMLREDLERSNSDTTLNNVENELNDVSTAIVNISRLNFPDDPDTDEEDVGAGRKKSKRGGSKETLKIGRERMGMAQEDIISQLAQKADETKVKRRKIVDELKQKNEMSQMGSEDINITTKQDRNIKKLSQKLDILEEAIKDFVKNEEIIKRKMEELNKHSSKMTKEQAKRFNKLVKKIEKLSL